jgi:hypothetical protein
VGSHGNANVNTWSNSEWNAEKPIAEMLRIQQEHYL